MIYIGCQGSVADFSLLQSSFGPELSYPVLVSSIKMSVLFSYKRIFGHYKWTRIHVYCLMFLSCGWGIAVFFTFLFQCWPISKAWNTQLGGTCIEFVPFLWANSVINFVIDWLVLAVPIVPVWHLQMNRVKKALVGGTIALGSLYVPIQSSTYDFH